MVQLFKSTHSKKCIQLLMLHKEYKNPDEWGKGFKFAESVIYGMEKNSI